MDPLQELSALLAVEVRDGRRERVIVNGRPQPQDSAWRLALPGARYAPEDPELVGDSRS